MTRNLVLLLTLFAVGRTQLARADTPPSIWDRARAPGSGARWMLHRNARMLMGLDSQIGVASFRELTLERARALLEGAGAATSPDVRLQFDLGEIYESLGHHEEAVELLGRAIRREPDHPAATDALATLAYAYAKLDRPYEERETYRRYLTYATDDRSRATAVLNLAEAEMRLGELQDAVAGYQEAIQVASSLPNFLSVSETGILAVWGLAVALDRSGDPARSYEQAKLATRMDPGEALVGNGPNVFFVPAYERLWYLALAAIVHAREATDVRLQATLWSRVEALWSAYVVNAIPTERWIGLAKAHLEQASTERIASEKRAGILHGSAASVPIAVPENP